MRAPSRFWMVPVAAFLIVGGVVGFLGGQEIRTSKIQSAYFSNIASESRYAVMDGAATHFYTPAFGPYNQRLGYSYLPFFFKALESEHFSVLQQVRTSRRFDELVGEGLYPVYQPKTQTGLYISDRTGGDLYRAAFPTRTFPTFESVPLLLIDTLLFIENRELLQPAPATKNPVIEWDRFIYAAFGQVLKIFMPGLNLGGGSTLATQIEKFRFSPGGQTGSAAEKIKQIISGSLRVYQNGPDTRAAREKIVLDYLNSTPLSARPGFGEINSIGDGLWAWFGHDLGEISDALRLTEDTPDNLRRKSIAFRECLGLILAQRRPTAYLLTDRAALDELTDQTLDKMYRSGVISSALRDATRATKFHFLPSAPPSPPVSFLQQKAVNAMRTHLLTLLGLRNLYELDRLDLQASSTLDQTAQQKLTAFLSQMANPEHVRSIGLYGFRLLKEDNDLSKIHWSVVLYERTPEGNKLRVQADNIDAPLDMNDGVKLDLGSTAKLRTLITYMEIVGELYRRYAGLSNEDLKELADEAPDVLTTWATTWLAQNPTASLEEMLEAALDRKYSANPGETFFTGGGAHTFVNFEKSEDHEIVNLRAALRDSINLPFVRLMRDIVNYTIAQGQQTKQELLSDPDHPARKAYLERYADREGTTFLNRYISDYKDLKGVQILQKITPRAHKGATSRAILFRSLYPNAAYADFRAYIRAAVPVPLDEERIRKLYDQYPADRYNLADRGYITGVNPMELWLAAYLTENPSASRSKILEVSKPIRIESYAWLFHPGKKGAQDTRIRILLELDAFARIQQRWARLGYPFDKLVPSLATAIGSSADRPGALAELVGILLNDGVRRPMLRFDKLHFASETPYETVLQPDPRRARRVLDPAIARAVRAAMTEVVENGTARRLRGAYVDANGQALPIGAKTGTGDHRYDEFGAGHKLISSRVVNRTGTIVFYIGDRFFGTVTAHVAGEQAAEYKFTSALSAQMLKSLAPIFQPLIAAPQADTATPQPFQAPLVEPETPAVPVVVPPAAPVQMQRPPKASAPPVPTPSIDMMDDDPAGADKSAPSSNDELMMDVLPR